MTPTRIFHSRTAMNMFSRIAITAIISILFMNTVAFAQQTASRVVTMRADTSAQEEAKAPVKSIQAPVVKSSKTGVVEIEAPSPDLVTATSYPFSSSTGVSLED